MGRLYLIFEPPPQGARIGTPGHGQYLIILG
jgi:hypothetical protein